MLSIWFAGYSHVPLRSACCRTRWSWRETNHSAEGLHVLKPWLT